MADQSAHRVVNFTIYEDSDVRVVHEYVIFHEFDNGSYEGVLRRVLFIPADLSKEETDDG